MPTCCVTSAPRCPSSPRSPSCARPGCSWERDQRDAQIVVDDLTEEQEKVDADVEAVKARRQRDRDRMDQGLISNPKDLERMSHELESLERRITDLEDQELEVMERLEEAQGTLDLAHRADRRPPTPGWPT